MKEKLMEIETSKLNCEELDELETNLRSLSIEDMKECLLSILDRLDITNDTITFEFLSRFKPEMKMIQEELKKS
ncbi:MAG: hypothetical protein M0R46_06345 [Candidatus Muirbacterium halophilum]|nr:hypothetical protein [Candidatus Muirbacterium halophilum]